MKIIVLGGNGMIGHKLVQVLSKDRELNVIAASRGEIDRRFQAPSARYVRLDQGQDPEVILNLVRREKPSVIINAIGIVKQKPAANPIESMLSINGLWPHLLAHCAESIQAQLIQISTDCVFAGTVGNYADDQTPNPIDWYGRSKAMGEVSYDRHLTLRTSILGPEFNGFAGLMSWFLRQPMGAELSGYTRAVFSGLPTIVFSEVIHSVVTSPRRLSGIFNVASAPITKFDLLNQIKGQFGHPCQIHRDPSLIVDRSLNGQKFAAASGFVCPPWPVLIARMHADYEHWPYEDIYTQLRNLMPAA